MSTELTSETTPEPRFLDPSDDVVTLPVGLEIDGTRFRRIRIDEMTGVDEENLSSKKKGKNPVAPFDLLLRRCIQGIEGLYEKKKQYGLCPAEYVQRMYQVDRDFLLVAIRVASLDSNITMGWKCGECGEANEDDVDLAKLPVTDWPVGEPPEIPFTLPKGLRHEDELHKEGIIAFPQGKHQSAVARLAMTEPGKAQTALLAACISRVGKVTSLDTSMVQRMSFRDRRAIGDAIIDKLPGVRLFVNLECEACGHEQEDQRIDLSAFFRG